MEVRCVVGLTISPRSPVSPFSPLSPRTPWKRAQFSVMYAHHGLLHTNIQTGSLPASTRPEGTGGSMQNSLGVQMFHRCPKILSFHGRPGNGNSNRREMVRVTERVLCLSRPLSLDLPSLLHFQRRHAHHLYHLLPAYLEGPFLPPSPGGRGRGRGKSAGSEGEGSCRRG